MPVQTADAGYPTQISDDASDVEAPAGIALPQKDWPILLAAMKARATHLVTGDVRHFGPYFGKRVQGVLIVTPVEYWKRRGVIP